MSSEAKKTNYYKLDSSEKILEKAPQAPRPNIDVLIKKINTERRREKLNNSLLAALGVAIVIVASIFFSQN